jgi:2-desacetyl-2-hydroxyethyl bacteriochlorophyllide A dehydrogenase
VKAIVNTGANRLEMRELSLPQPGPGEVRIRTGACGICATDLQMIAGWERTGFPAIPGHEWAGMVDAVGEGLEASLIGCKCVAENVLSDGGEVGFEHPGGYAEYLLTEAANVRVLPRDYPLNTATLIEPLAVCVRAMRRLRSDVVDPVLLLGDGTIGLLMGLLLLRGGLKRIVVVGGRDSRLKVATDFGANQILNYHAFTGDLAVAIRREAGENFPTIVEATGSISAMNAALELVASCGRILLLGDYDAARADFPWNHLLHREMELIGSNASAGAWPEAVRLAVQGDLPLDRLITHRLPSERFREGIELMRSRSGEVIKVVLEWD